MQNFGNKDTEVIIKSIWREEYELNLFRIELIDILF